MIIRKFLVLNLTVYLMFSSIAQEQYSPTNGTKRILDTLTYEQQAGLPVAASKIYFSDKKFTISGFGESSYINYLGPKNKESQDLELYNTNLQRFVLYGAYKPLDWMVLYAELFAEFANDGREESHFEYMPEVFIDLLFNPHFNVRLGTHQVSLGYINNNDEPILYYTVNRPEVERLLIPSQWIDLGVMTYGKINNDLKWTASVYQGLDALNLNGATWIRRGRDESLRFNFDSYVLNGKIAYTGIKNTELALNGIWTPLGRGESTSMGKLEANTALTSAYARYTNKGLSIMALGTYGQMQNTNHLFSLTADAPLGSQVMGSSVYGFYTEVSYDILPLLGFNKHKEGAKRNLIYDRKEVKLPVFARIERLNTHATVEESIAHENRNQSDLTALAVGFNFNPKRNIVFKANYQFRWNTVPLSTGEFEGDRFELGLGFIF